MGRKKKTRVVWSSLFPIYVSLLHISYFIEISGKVKLCFFSFSNPVTSPCPCREQVHTVSEAMVPQGAEGHPPHTKEPRAASTPQSPMLYMMATRGWLQVPCHLFQPLSTLAPSPLRLGVRLEVASMGEFWNNLSLDNEGFPTLFQQKLLFSVFLFIILTYTLLVIDLE